MVVLAFSDHFFGAAGLPSMATMGDTKALQDALPEAQTAVTFIIGVLLNVVVPTRVLEVVGL